ncbi:MAG: 50S ribosomal protein L23 [Candidatus Ancillula sp.]|jgi:large subunit ribosomal protein L23|nr:50S ribosomal protein L23 [Candidatus Ancillula sp.]
MTDTNLTNFKDPHDILLGPVVSEKSFELADSGKYTFKIAKTANKTEVKNAIQQIFGVKVLSVNTLNRQGKVTRTRFGYGKRNNEKRAIVTVAPGDVINVFGTEQAK